MQLCELAEMAAVVSSHAPVLVADGRPLSPAGMGQYWTASKCRLDRWSLALKEYRDSTDRRPSQGEFRTWTDIRPVMEEILVGEILTRVWTAVTIACDQSAGASESEPIAQSVLLGQMEARNRALRLMVHGPGISASEAVALNRLRRRTERWTDLLVGHLATSHDVSHLAFDPQRAQDFAHDLKHQRRCGVAPQAWQLTMAAIRTAFEHDLNRPVANVRLTRDIGDAVLACFPSTMFHATGNHQSLWLMRLYVATSDTQGLIDELFASDDRPLTP